MPGSSTIQHFVNDLRDGKSNITRALDKLFEKNPGRHKPPTGDDDVDKAANWLSAPGSSPYPLNQAAKNVLMSLGLTGAELDHIDKWPSVDKKKVLDELANEAIGKNKPYHFFWELTLGNKEETEIISTGTRKITFRSPRTKIKEVTALSGEVTVDV